MIIKGASRSSVKFWTKHLRDTKANERAEMVDTRGLLAENLADLLSEIQDNAHLTRCKNAMYIASFSPAIGETLNEAQWERSFEIFEQARGIPEGQRRIVYEHEKEGRIHRHVVWDRIDIDKLKAFPDAHDWKVCAAASHEITQELGLQHTPGILFREPGAPRPERNPAAWEMFRGMASEIDPRALKAEVTALYKASANGTDFAAMLKEKGFELCKGDRRNFLILDSAGQEHSLARRLEGVKANDLKTFMADIDREALPTLAEAKGNYQQRKAASLHAEPAKTRDDIQPEETRGSGEQKPAQGIADYERRFADTLQNAALAKEDNQRRIAELKPAPKSAPERKGTAAEIHAAFTGSTTGQEFAYRLEDKGRAVLACATAADAEKLNQQQEIKAKEKARQQFKAGAVLASVNQQQPETAAKDKALPSSLPMQKYQAGDLLVINDFGSVYRLTERNTGAKKRARTERFKDIDAAALPSVDTARLYMAELKQQRREDSRKQWAQERAQERQATKAAAPELKGTAADMRLAYTLSASGQGFVSGLEDRRLILSCATAADAERLNRQQEAKATDKGQTNKPTRHAYQAGELLVINPFGHAYRLTETNTGDDRHERAAYLKNIDRAALPSVERAQAQAEQQRKAALPELKGTAAEIRLARTLTASGQGFANALEDRGLILANTTVADAEKLNQEQAARAKEKGQPTQQAYQPGELLVINPSGHAYRLTEANTGLERQERAEYLKQIDRAALLNVADARSSMRDLSEHRRFDGPEKLRGTAAKIWMSYRQSDSPQAFANAMLEKGIRLAVVTKDEAESSRQQAEAAKAAGHAHATGFMEHETVAVNRRGQVYRLSERITGSTFGDMQAYLRNGLDRSKLPGIERARELNGLQPARSDDRPASSPYDYGKADKARIERFFEIQKGSRDAARVLKGHANMFDRGGSSEYSRSSILDRTERRTMENEQAASRARNTRDR